MVERKQVRWKGGELCYLVSTRVVTSERHVPFINRIFKDAFQNSEASDLLGGCLPHRKPKPLASPTFCVGELRTKQL